MNEELKPCPLCGSAEIGILVKGVFNKKHIYCKNCYLELPGTYTREKAKEIWNTRPELKNTLRKGNRGDKR